MPTCPRCKKENVVRKNAKQLWCKDCDFVWSAGNKYGKFMGIGGKPR